MNDTIAPDESEEQVIERVAQALWDSEWRPSPWPQLSELTRAVYRLRAPHIIAAVRGSRG